MSGLAQRKRRKELHFVPVLLPGSAAQLQASEQLDNV